MRKINYRGIEEKALANFELLLNYWKIPYVKISDDEYDFKNPTRQDDNFGACRFNVVKGKGADFAGINFSKFGFGDFGPGFSKEDFASPKKGELDNWGFNIIGLCQRITGLESYADAARELERIFGCINNDTSFRIVTEEYIRKRDEDRERANTQKKINAAKIWGFCSLVSNTLGEVYLRSRSIFLSEDEPNMRFHPRIKNQEVHGYFPALLFKVEHSPGSGLVAVHRIYLNPDGTGKANVNNPKMALGTIKNAAIWFGGKSKILYIAEGPENALSLRSIGYNFLVSTISAANFSSLRLPDYIDRVVLCPDNDLAGKTAAQKAYQEYHGRQKKKVEISYPPKEYKDWNDMLKGTPHGRG